MYFRINEPNKPVKFIKSVDAEKGILTFQSDSYGAYSKSSGFFANAEFDYLKFHFEEKYPELKYMEQY